MPTDVGRFHVVSTLGEGGMGVVYAAQDTSLGRRVAIKMLRGTSTDPAARERLVREARAAARVSHPAVCQVYEVGVHEGEPYVAMELLEGEPLSARIARGPIPLREAVDLALGILEGLSALHRHGIVHRDLKPSNVFLTPTGVKLLDLGLALPIQEDLTQTDVRLTRTGMLIGTPGFMAPEQWTHEGVGPSADLFALGALLHEMLSGKPAFLGANLLDIYHSILHEPAPVLTGGPGVDAVDRVIRHALEKRPEDRPPTAAAMADDLRAARKAVPEGDGAAGESAPPPKARRQTRIAVLPFRVARPDPDTDFLGPGLADSLTAALAALEGVVVRSPQASARAAGPDADLEALAVRAQIDLVLQGTVMKAGDRVRVQIQLVEAPGGAVVKADSIVMPVGDVFALEDELTRRIVESLALPLSGRNAKSVRPTGPAGQEAYELYLRANAAALHSSRLSEARDLYRAALQLDPSYAPAWARLGRVHRVRAKYGQSEAAREDLRLAEEAFRRSLTLDPDLAMAHHLFTHFEIEESGRADLAMVRLLERGRAHPAEAELYGGLVVACRFNGLLRASVAADRAARRLEPGIRTSIGYTWWMLGEWEKAMVADDGDARFLHQYTLPMQEGGEARALALLDELQQRAPSGIFHVLIAANRASILRDRGAMDAATATLMASDFHDPEGLYFSARAYARVGSLDAAMATLERVVAGGLFIPSVLRSDPWMAAAREHPAFAGLLARSDAGHVRAVELYREAGGERLLGVDAS